MRSLQSQELSQEKRKPEKILVKDPGPNGRTIILREFVDVKKLKYIVKRPKRFSLFDQDDSESIREGKMVFY